MEANGDGKGMEESVLIHLSFFFMQEYSSRHPRLSDPVKDFQPVGIKFMG